MGQGAREAGGGGRQRGTGPGLGRLGWRGGVAQGREARGGSVGMALQGRPAEDIRAAITERFDYDLTESVDSIRTWYSFDESCAGTVPQAIICALDATDFEDAIRNAISIGGDSDTIAAITGGIAEGMFGVPEAIEAKARSYLSEELDKVVSRFAERVGGTQ